jgi:hypothetical protein
MRDRVSELDSLASKIFVDLIVLGLDSPGYCVWCLGDVVPPLVLAHAKKT